jgi:hypothetical protein
MKKLKKSTKIAMIATPIIIVFGIFGLVCVFSPNSNPFIPDKSSTLRIDGSNLPAAIGWGNIGNGYNGLSITFSQYKSVWFLSWNYVEFDKILSTDDQIATVLGIKTSDMYLKNGTGRIIWGYDDQFGNISYGMMFKIDSNWWIQGGLPIQTVDPQILIHRILNGVIGHF